MDDSFRDGVLFDSFTIERKKETDDKSESFPESQALHSFVGLELNDKEKEENTVSSDSNSEVDSLIEEEQAFDINNNNNVQLKTEISNDQTEFVMKSQKEEVEDYPPNLNYIVSLLQKSRSYS